jgi:hypothetical protein
MHEYNSLRILKSPRWTRRELWISDNTHDTSWERSTQLILHSQIEHGLIDHNFLRRSNTVIALNQVQKTDANTT